MADIVIAEFMDPEVVRTLSDDYDVLYDPGLAGLRSDLIATVGKARGLIIRNETVVDSDLLDAAPLLEVIGRLGVGLDNIDIEACRSRGVQVCPATGANTDAVAEYVIAALLCLVRGAFQSTDSVTSGSWPRTDMDGLEIAGRTLGLIGFGDISRRVAPMAIALGMRVVAHDPFLADDNPAWGSVESVGLQDLFVTSDAISLHVPLTDETEGLIDQAAIASMKQTAVLVNTARGGIVDEASLIEALRDGRLRGAALDVYTHEPIDQEHGEQFVDVPNLILTPHIAGLTAESNARVGRMTADHVVQVLERGVS